MYSTDIERITEIRLEKLDSVLLADLLVRAASPERGPWNGLPLARTPGIYAVCLPDWQDRRFNIDAGNARYANPAGVKTLKDKRNRILAAGPTDILYIGASGCLRRRMQQLGRFGMGRAKNHKGGEWLWQVEEIGQAKTRMWCCTGSSTEQNCKSGLLVLFQEEHKELPLANRED